MNEYLLHYLWKNSLYAPGALTTTEREQVVVLSPGKYNTNAGPDFLEARVKIGNTLWVGNVELHLRTSDWLKHHHDQDEAYRHIILHVVYEDDFTLSGCNFPTLELKAHLNQPVIERYQGLMSARPAILCTHRLKQVPELIWQSWLDRLLLERWEHRLKEWEGLWIQADKDWRTLLYYRLATNFGFHVNRDAFLELALSLPLNVLARHRKDLFTLEALLFGQSGLLPVDSPDTYTAALEKEYHFLRRKYQLIAMPAHHWRFMRLRPPNFPTIRIAQFAMLVHTSLELFAKIMEIRTEKELLPMLNIRASAYWDTHYRFGEATEENVVKKLGKDSVHNILLNTVAPMQYLYAKLQGKDNLQESSMTLLQSVRPENNHIIRQWQDVNIVPVDGAQSQALLQLFHNYCSARNCLDCAVGNHILRTP